MIERLLAAEAALERGDLELAERLFRQVADTDPRNAIAAVGMGRVAAARDDAEGARRWFVRALEIDPDEAAARRLLAALEREVASMGAAAAASDDEAPAIAGTTEPGPVETRSVEPAPRPSLLARSRRWLGRRRS